MSNKHGATWIGNLKPSYFLLKAQAVAIRTGPQGAGALQAEMKQGRPPEILMELSWINLKGAAAEKKEGNP